MRKVLIGSAAFVVSAVAGLVFWVVGSFLIAMLPQIASQRTSGIGAIAGGVSGGPILLIAILCGCLGAALVLRRLNRRGI